MAHLQWLERNPFASVDMRPGAFRSISGGQPLFFSPGVLDIVGKTIGGFEIITVSPTVVTYYDIFQDASYYNGTATGQFDIEIDENNVIQKLDGLVDAFEYEHFEMDTGSQVHYRIQDLGLSVQDFLALPFGDNQLEEVLSGDDVIEGSDLDAYGDFLIGYAGDDILIGKRGDDTYYVESKLDRVIEAAGQGYDRVYATTDFALLQGFEVERLNLEGAATRGTGNEYANVLTGNDQNNELNGLAGHDYLVGEGGDDVLRGGHGRDWLYGQDGNDQLSGGFGDDRLIGGDGDDGLAGGDGEDRLIGGEGRDLFVFYEPDLWDNHDIIHDFNVVDDRIHLTYMDAKAGKDGDQAFNWVGGAIEFGGSKGELHYFHDALTTYVEGDIDGDALADFQIELAGTLSLSEDSFFL